MQLSPKLQLPFLAATLFVPPLFLHPVQAQNQAAVITDPDAANAPIADRETFNVRPKETRDAPELDAIKVPRTSYPTPPGAIFVASNGYSKTSGLDRNAPTTLATAVATAPSGATIVLKGGTYRGVSGLKIPRRMTLQAAPGERVWIKGSVLVSGFAKDGAGWSAAWDKKLMHANKEDLDKANPIAGETDMVFVGGRSLGQVMTLAELKPGTFFVDTTAKKLVLGADPRGKSVESTVSEIGLDIKGEGAKGTTLRGLGFAHYSVRAVEAFGQKMTVENNAFAWNAARGLVLHGADHVVRGNTFACNGLSGMQTVYADRLLFENNRVVFNNIEGFRPTWSAAGTKMVIAKDMTLRNNVYENNQAAALWLDISCVNTTIIGNTVRSNKGLGVFYELCHGGVVAFNVIQDNGVGLMLSDASGVRAWNNTFLDNAKAIVVKDTPRFNDTSKDEGFYSNQRKADDIALGATWIAASNEFHNNIFAGARNDKTVLFDAGPAMKGKGSSDMITGLDNNVYARTSPGLPRLLVRWHTEGKPADFDSLAAFRGANAAFETSSTEMNAAPASKANNYALAPQSPLLFAGKALPADVKSLALQAGITLRNGSTYIGARGAAK